MYTNTLEEQNMVSIPEALWKCLVNRFGRIDVHTLMVAKGLKQTEIAKKYNIDRTDLNKVIHGERRTQHIRNILATELGIDPNLLWRRKNS